MFVSTRTDEVNVVAILFGPRLHQPRDFHLAQARGYPRELVATKVCWDFLEQRLDVVNADGLQHCFYVGVSVWDKRH